MTFLGRRVDPLIGALIAAIVSTTLVAALDGGTVAHALALRPSLVARGQLWRLGTWALVEATPLQLIFGCLTLYRFGDELAATWSRRLLHRYLAMATLGVGVTVCALSLILPGAWYAGHLAGWALGDALVIGWATSFPDRRVRLYFVLEVGGEQLINAIVAINAVFAVFYGVVALLPELCAVGLAIGFTRASSPSSPRY